VWVLFRGERHNRREVGESENDTDTGKAMKSLVGLALVGVLVAWTYADRYYCRKKGLYGKQDSPLTTVILIVLFFAALVFGLAYPLLRMLT